MITITYQEIETQFGFSPAMTLSPGEIGGNDSGWTIEGEIQQDYFSWVNKFKASHPVHGTVEGDFEDEIQATSREAYDHFVQYHQPELWDYLDI
jgi:hypothetical protein